MQSYLEKNAFYERLIHEHIPEGLKLVVVIPSYNEIDLLNSIRSLQQCHFNSGLVEILPILNCPESSESAIHALHSTQYIEIQKLSEETKSDSIRVHGIKPFILPDKISGVGLARKLGMDEAVRRFERIGKDGIILNFDADCSCNQDYLNKVTDYFDNKPATQALTIGFSHRWNELEEAQRQAIIKYELHLRCYIGWQKYYGYPFAFQTLGSCFAVKSKAYQAQGGMNKRKAGEDFYFLHKFSILGELSELNQNLVYPSGRISDRVPFGTGKAVGDIISSARPFKSYNPQAIHVFSRLMKLVSLSFDDIKKRGLIKILDLENSLKEFLLMNSFEEVLESAIQNSSNATSFEKRISKWFDPFRLMKYLHYARAFEFPDVDILDSAKALAILSNPELKNMNPSEESLLNVLTGIAYREANNQQV